MHNVQSASTGKFIATHGFATPGNPMYPTYLTWRQIRRRCNNPRNPSYANYGGRGIRVDPRWNTFEAFFSDMGVRPNGASIDRVDNDGPYSPENCRWSDPIQQSRNRRTNKLLCANGVTLCMVEWAEKLGVKYCNLKEYVKRHGWDAAYSYYTTR